MNPLYCYCVLILFISCQTPAGESLAWPEIQAENKPWTRWWWHGSSVSTEGIAAELELYKASGIGGMEITPIYGVRGEESEFVPYLSADWVELLTYTLEEAREKGLGIDMATGTGWPFGGPWVDASDASKYLVHKTYLLESGERLDELIQYQQEAYVRAVNRRDIEPEDLQQPISENRNLQALAIDQVRFGNKLPLVSLVAYSESGEVLEIRDRVDANGRLEWQAPVGKWTLYAVFQGLHGKMVERAAPGGEGLVIDHFSDTAIIHYLDRFDAALAGESLKGLRAFFNDSYEVDDARGQANFSPDLLAEFKERKGYDLEEHWPALFGEDEAERNHRVLTDYRDVVSDLLLETFTKKWAAWAASQGKIIRNQAHGSPSNILDLYAAADIPETEGTDLIRIKFATSAGHVGGKQLISAEAATWLDEHFLSNLSDLKQNLDRYLVGGVNHIFYHGSTYSPLDDPWPGRLFYAAIHANPRNALWPHFKTLNQYIARAQSFLQQGQVDHDVLLYFPAYDRFASPTRELLDHFDGHGESLEKSAFKAVADELLHKGYAFDYISDKQIWNLETQKGKLLSGQNRYQVVLVPKTTYMPLLTLLHLVDLAREGAHIVFLEALPESVPGMEALAFRSRELSALIQDIPFAQNEHGMQIAQLGSGQIMLGAETEALLAEAGVFRESMTDLGLQYARRRIGNKRCYFISNWSGNTIESWVPVQSPGKSTALFDPMTGKKGIASVRSNKTGQAEVYLQLAQGESCILLVSEQAFAGQDWQYFQQSGEKNELATTWTVDFVKGGPEIPASFQTDSLESWTAQSAPSYQQFSGTARYKTSFQRPAGDYTYYLLDLGEVKEAATVYLNGDTLGDLLGPFYRILIPSEQLKADNQLEIEVSNLMANRIAALDRAEVPWKKFYNINMSARIAENRNAQGLFDASAWAPRASGLLGPVSLQGGEAE